jgi:hypothetical protein
VYLRLLITPLVFAKSLSYKPLRHLITPLASESEVVNTRMTYKTMTLQIQMGKSEVANTRMAYKKMTLQIPMVYSEVANTRIRVFTTSDYTIDICKVIVL